MDCLSRFISSDGRVRVLAVIATNAAQEVIRRHELKGSTAGRLAADGTVCALLLSAHVKGEERILVEVSCDEPRFVFSGEASADGKVRARLRPTRLGAVHHLKGRMAAVKWNAHTELYRGLATVDHKDLQAVLRGYLQDSQQTLGRAWLHSRVRYGKVSFAGGLLIERLPVRDGLDQTEFDALMDSLEGDEPRARIECAQAGIIPGLSLESLETRPVQFSCRCSLERVESTLCTLGAADIRSLAEEQGQAEVTCDFCMTRYVVPKSRMHALADAMESTAVVS
jgi:molecular chaperone Hsp33